MRRDHRLSHRKSEIPRTHHGEVWTCAHGRIHDSRCCPYKNGHGFAFWRPGIPSERAVTSRDISQQHGVISDQSYLTQTNNRIEESRSFAKLLFPFELQSASIIVQLCRLLKLTELECCYLQRDFWYNYLRSFEVMKMSHEADRLRFAVNPSILTILERLIENPPPPLDVSYWYKEPIESAVLSTKLSPISPEAVVAEAEELDTSPSIQPVLNQTFQPESFKPRIQELARIESQSKIDVSPSSEPITIFAKAEPRKFEEKLIVKLPTVVSPKGLAQPARKRPLFTPLISTATNAEKDSLSLMAIVETDALWKKTSVKTNSEGVSSMMESPKTPKTRIGIAGTRADTTSSSNAEEKPKIKLVNNQEWRIEFQNPLSGERVSITVDRNVDPSHNLVIRESSGLTVDCKQKINAVQLMECKSLNVIVQDVNENVEIASCEMLELEIIGKCSSITVDHATDITITLSHESREATIATSDCSCVAVRTQRIDSNGNPIIGDWFEVPVSEEYMGFLSAKTDKPSTKPAALRTQPLVLNGGESKFQEMIAAEMMAGAMKKSAGEIESYVDLSTKKHLEKLLKEVGTYVEEDVLKKQVVKPADTAARRLETRPKEVTKKGVEKAIGKKVTKEFTQTSHKEFTKISNKSYVASAKTSEIFEEVSIKPKHVPTTKVNEFGYNIQPKVGYPKLPVTSITDQIESGESLVAEKVSKKQGFRPMNKIVEQIVSGEAEQVPKSLQYSLNTHNVGRDDLSGSKEALITPDSLSSLITKKGLPTANIKSAMALEQLGIPFTAEKGETDYGITPVDAVEKPGRPSVTKLVGLDDSIEDKETMKKPTATLNIKGLESDKKVSQEKTVKQTTASLISTEIPESEGIPSKKDLGKPTPPLHPSESKSNGVLSKEALEKFGLPDLVKTQLSASIESETKQEKLPTTVTTKKVASNNSKPVQVVHKKPIPFPTGKKLEGIKRGESEEFIVQKPPSLTTNITREDDGVMLGKVLQKLVAPPLAKESESFKKTQSQREHEDLITVTQHVESKESKESQVRSQEPILLPVGKKFGSIKSVESEGLLIKPNVPILTTKTIPDDSVIFEGVLEEYDPQPSTTKALASKIELKIVPKEPPGVSVIRKDSLGSKDSLKKIDQSLVIKSDRTNNSKELKKALKRPGSALIEKTTGRKNSITLKNRPKESLALAANVEDVDPKNVLERQSTPLHANEVELDNAEAFQKIPKKQGSLPKSENIQLSRKMKPDREQEDQSITIEMERSESKENNMSQIVYKKLIPVPLTKKPEDIKSTESQRYTNQSLSLITGNAGASQEGSRELSSVLSSETHKVVDSKVVSKVLKMPPAIKKKAESLDSVNFKNPVAKKSST